jgi:hypothetical protein
MKRLQQPDAGYSLIPGSRFFFCGFVTIGVGATRHTYALKTSEHSEMKWKKRREQADGKNGEQRDGPDELTMKSDRVWKETWSWYSDSLAMLV